MAAKALKMGDPLIGVGNAHIALGVKATPIADQESPSLSRVAPSAQEVSVVRSAAILLGCWP